MQKGHEQFLETEVLIHLNLHSNTVTSVQRSAPILSRVCGWLINKTHFSPPEYVFPRQRLWSQISCLKLVAMITAVFELSELPSKHAHVLVLHQRLGSIIS